MQLVHENGRLGSFLKWSWFELRAARLRLARGALDLRDWLFPPSRANVVDSTKSGGWSVILGKSVTPLWTAQTPAEKKLVEGKVQNLRIAAARINGKILAPNEVFSFWSHVGPPWRSRGFVKGRELREGCLIASVGGGLCQLSNALHLAALEAGLTIVERHAHSKTIPGSVAATGRDATVFWNYKDLRLQASVPFVIDAILTETNLVVRFRAAESRITRESNNSPQAESAHLPEPAHACLDCQHRECIYHGGPVYR